MRKEQILMLCCLFLFVTGQAQVSKTVNVSAAGTLSTFFTSAELTSVTNLTVAGVINAADFGFVRDSLTALSDLDLSNSSIAALNGMGTNGTGIYNANEIPAYSFCPYNGSGKASLVSVSLPISGISVGTCSFSGCYNLKTINLPEQITTIGAYAFQGCIALTTLILPSHLASIEMGAFSGCYGIKGVLALPSSMISLGRIVFDNCSGLTAINIPPSVSTITDGAFQGCGANVVVDGTNPYYSSAYGVLFDKTKTRLISCPGTKSGAYTIPTTVTSIADYAFMNNHMLTSVVLPPSLVSVGNYAFDKCSNINTLSLPLSLVSVGDYGFAELTFLSSLIIPRSVTSIGKRAFSSCIHMKTVVIPTSVTSFGMEAFSGCTGLTAIHANANIPADLSTASGMFYNVPATTCTLYVPVGSMSLYKLANQWQDFSNIVEEQISKSLNVDSAGTLSTFFSSTELSTVANLTVAGSINAADFCFMRDSLKALSVLDLSGATIVAYTGRGTNDSTFYKANEVPAYAFYNRKTPVSKASLTSVSFPGSVTSLGANSFYGCKNIYTIILPAQTTLIDNSAFQACSGLKTVIFPSGVITIGDYAFESCSGLKGSFSIPPSVTSIGLMAFGFCTGLSDITIPSSVSAIGDEAFISCNASLVVDSSNVYYSSIDGVLFDKSQTKLLSFPLSKGGSYSIPSTVTAIGNYAFMYNTLLTSITIPSSVTSIGNYSFCKSRGLTSISLPQSVVNIGDFSFASNATLSSITIPSSVTSIGRSAFFACTGLKSVTIPSSVTSMGGSAFNGCTGLTSVYVNALTPIDLSTTTSVFYNVPVATCTLYVPVGSLSLYKAANQWQNFTNMLENTTAVPKVIHDNIRVWFRPQLDVLYINGIAGKYNLYIQDINGINVLAMCALCGNEIAVKSLPQGIYIVTLQSAGGIITGKIIKE